MFFVKFINLVAVKSFLWEAGRNLSIPCYSTKKFVIHSTTINKIKPIIIHKTRETFPYSQEDVLKKMYWNIVSIFGSMRCNEGTWGTGGLVPLIRNFDSKCSRVVCFTLRLLYLWGRAPPFPRYLFIRRLGEPQSLSGSLGGYRLLPRNRTTVLWSSDP